MKINKALGVAVASLIAATMLACGGSPGDGTTTPDTPSETAAAAKDGGPVTAQLGGKGLVFKREQVSVTIGKPTAYKPGQFAQKPGKGERAFVVTVAVTNHRDDAIKLATMMLTASVDGTEAEPIFDFDAKLKGTPETALLPGKTVRFSYGWLATTTAKNPPVVLSVNFWDLGTATGLFQGSL